ncbi:MAG: phosphomethylpyrimidine synthase ThiC [Methanoculleaceae archaeon]
MKTAIQCAREGMASPAITGVLEKESIDTDTLLRHIAEGSAVVMTRGDCAVGIGKGCTTKVNVNIGTSSARVDMEGEVEKASIAEKFGADTITDLSMGGDIPEIRRRILENTTVPLTTVPIYETVAALGPESVSEEEIINTIRRHADEGVSSFVLHCPTKQMVDGLKGNRRVMGVVSKGGALTIAYMLLNRCENPFLENLDKICSIMKSRDIVLSLGNTMRSGCIHDSFDRFQEEEMRQNAEIGRIANEAGIQVIVEGCGGHIRADRIVECVRSYKEASPFPLFVAGPLPTDRAVGYDHIAACVGASLASGAGADYLCYITPAEHIGLPDAEQVREGLIACRIAAHIGDTIKYSADDGDLELAKRRAVLDWKGQMKHAIDPYKALEMAPETGPCTMCGDYCALKIMKQSGIENARF